jgi:nucleotide-binding universal stress UspA family protein
MKAIDARTRIQVSNILFATDFSPASSAAIPYVTGLAKHFGARLHVVHVRPIAVGPLLAPGATRGAAEAARVDLEERTNEILASFPAANPEVLIEEGAVWPNIDDVISSREIDLVVVGTHGRSGVAKLLLGSVAEEIFRKATCPVLTVGPHSHAMEDEAGELKTILFATDMSLRSSADAYALALAQEYQARLVLLHVAPVAEVLDVPRSAEALSYLVPQDVELWCQPEYVVATGPVADTILKVADQKHADLIVMGARKAEGIPGASTRLPTTAQKVVSHAACPVLTVRD